MPIAVNMIPISFNFGEYIIREGEIPKGLYIIKSGQCKVASIRIADRV
jgi:CRP-like cAMP-binding protein